jgi:hypothetical protein
MKAKTNAKAKAIAMNEIGNKKENKKEKENENENENEIKTNKVSKSNSNYTFPKKIKKSLLNNTEDIEDLPEKFEVYKIEKSNQPEKINLCELGDDQKNLRQKAFNLMKKKVLNKEELNILSKANLNNEPLNKKNGETIYYQNNEANNNINKYNTYTEDNKYSKKVKINIDKKDIAEKYNKYFNENFVSNNNNNNRQKTILINNNNTQEEKEDEGEGEGEDNNINSSYNSFNDIYKLQKEKNKQNAFKYNDNNVNNNNDNDIINIIERNINNYTISQKYNLGIDIDISLNHNFCFHKIHKWFAYIFNNKIIIEDFSNEDFRKQIFFDESKYKLSAVKTSPNNNYLISFSINSFIIEKETNKEFDFSDLNSYNVFEEESFQNLNLSNNHSNNKSKISKIKIKINPHIFIWDIKNFLIEDENPIYKNITKISIKHNKIFDVEFSPQNNLCIFSSKILF